MKNNKMYFTNDNVLWNAGESERVRPFLVLTSGAHYDSILLDACTTDVKEVALCPAPVFRAPEVIENLSKVCFFHLFDICSFVFFFRFLFGSVFSPGGKYQNQ